MNYIRNLKLLKQYKKDSKPFTDKKMEKLITYGNKWFIFFKVNFISNIIIKILYDFFYFLNIYISIINRFQYSIYINIYICMSEDK